jgi:DNA polymerase-3 subunit delta'
MDNNLLLHPKTSLQLQYTLKNPSHGLAIVAPNGSGKKTIAKMIATSLLELPSVEKLESYPYFFHIRRLNKKNDISIEQVREVIGALKLKAPGTREIMRVVFIEDAHFLNIPAQNALLKVLEEPNSDTVFLLSINSIQNVLPTISSRVQKLEVLPVSLNESLDFWQDQYSKELIESAWRLSGGATGLTLALLTESKDHPLKIAVDEAKQFLKSSKYQRLLQIDSLSKNKENLENFIEALGRTLNFLQHVSVKAGREIQSKNILISRKILQESTKALEANTSSKLVGLKLVLSLKV